MLKDAPPFLTTQEHLSADAVAMHASAFSAAQLGRAGAAQAAPNPARHGAAPRGHMAELIRRGVWEVAGPGSWSTKSLDALVELTVMLAWDVRAGVPASVFKQAIPLFLWRLVTANTGTYRVSVFPPGQDISTLCRMGCSRQQVFHELQKAAALSVAWGTQDS
eukprot:scaffold21011_cov19-Tisochrysis_lutea.AAC.1